MDLITAKLAADGALLSYKNRDGKQDFLNLGFTTHKFINKNGAQAHFVKNKENVFIFCRGTEATALNDLLADLNLFPKTHGEGFVHSGFRNEARKILIDVKLFVEKNKHLNIVLAGHSLGGAMSTYLAQELHHAGYSVSLYTFGSPRVGDNDYCDCMENIPHWRFVNNNDVVTSVPPMALGFRHSGTIKYISYTGDITDMSWKQRLWDQLRGRFRAICKFQLFDGSFDHSMKLYHKKIKKHVDKQK